MLSLVIHFYRIERAPLDEAGKEEIFPGFRRGVGEASISVDPLDDQYSTCDAQAIPRPIGIRLIPREPDAASKWLSEGCHSLDQYDILA